jgi:microcystin-dependent protein
MEALLQRTGDTMSGDLDMDNNDLKNARITDDPVIVGGQLVGTALRGAEDDASNEIVVPDDGSRATAGGSPILTTEDGVMESMPVGAVIMWYGSIGAIPSGWQNCDGTGGTPDMRGAFPRGVSGSIALGASGGAATAAGSTSSDGAHTPTGDVGSHALSTDEMPAHRHRLRASSGGGISASATLTNGAAYGLLADSTPGHSAAGLDDTTHPANTEWVETVGGGQAHDHSLSLDPVGNHSHTIDSVSTIPPYKALYFIMKVS